VAALVIAHEHVALRHPRGREQQGRWDVGQGVGLVRPDVHELRRRAAGRAVTAGDDRVVLAVNRGLRLGKPRGEPACVDRDQP